MKKIILIITMFIIGFTLSGCIRDSDEEISNKNITELISFIENNDSAGVKSLFAKNVVEKDNDLDIMIEELLRYYEGDFQSMDNSGLGTESDKGDGVKTVMLNSSTDVTTSKGIYRLAIHWYIEDSGDVNNIGIWSLYIIKLDDDIDKDAKYRGDGLWTIGINIGKVYEDE